MHGMTAFLFLCYLCLSAHGAPKSSPQRAQRQPSSEQEFRQKLSQMLQRTEKSIKLLTAQITESLSAPFLPDLYLQLAELLSQKSNTLYYIQMEIQKGAETKSDKEFSPVVTAQKEAIATYRMILKDFPKYQKRSNVMYRLALALKSIDELPEFESIASQVVREFRSGEDAIRCQILLGQYYFERREYPQALNYLKPVAQSTFVYERNLAEYKVGLIYLEGDQFKEALKAFEKVISDSELKEQDNPYQVSLKERSAKSNLKREALIDSIRAYTHVYEKNHDASAYYSKLAPTEVLFQEVIEKLTIRYIGQKRYDMAIRLLRTLGERTVDPEKTVNIYRDVLRMIPMSDRTALPVEELKYVLEKFNLWNSYYQPPQNLVSKSYTFFETQTRELGTTSHSYAKQSRKSEAKKIHLERAKDFYLLYLGFFSNAPDAVKIATNLGDVYYSLGNFYKCGEYYLRTFSGEFGNSREKKALIENAIFCLQKKAEFPFYENLRLHGLLIKSVRTYMAFDGNKQNDPVLNFVLLKTEYEQGFFPETLNNLFSFMKRFPRSKQAIDAGELILDYFNTRADYASLQTWANRLLSLHLSDQQFNGKLSLIKKSAFSKAIQEKVRSTAGFDDFAQGKSYLAAALSSGNTELANLVLREALAKSKREHDFDTFLKTASVMASKEKNSTKKAEILRSIANEQVRITRYYSGLASLKAIYEDSHFSSSVRQATFDEALGVVLVLKDWNSLASLSRSPLWRGLGPGVKMRLHEQIMDILDSPVAIKPFMADVLLRDSSKDEELLSLFKARYKLGGSTSRQVTSRIKSRCSGGDNRQTLCLWQKLESLDTYERANFLKGLQTARPDLKGVEAQAQKFAAITAQYKNLEGSSDPHLEIATSLREAELYQGLARFLTTTANKNPDLKPVLLQKANETSVGATNYLSRCKDVAQRSTTPNPAAKYCSGTQTPTFRQMLETHTTDTHSSSHSDPSSGNLKATEKELFGSPNGGDALLKLAKEYLDRGELSHASAAASYGISLYKSLEGDFHAILTCTTVKMGFLSEATYHFKQASDFGGLKNRCNQQVIQLKSRI